MEYHKTVQNSCTESYKIKTPHFNHIKESDWEQVYEPAEDTFLLIDAIEKDLQYIFLMKPKIVLEVGSGSGIIITALSKVLQSSSFCMATDINPKACIITKSTATQNHTSLDVIQTDLTSCLKKFSISMVVFNPPYVVTPSSEVNSKDLLTRSWAGGINGREVIDKFLSKFIDVMDKKSFGYLLLLKENQPFEIMSYLTNRLYKCEIISEKKIRGENLIVIKFIKM